MPEEQHKMSEEVLEMPAHLEEKAEEVQEKAKEQEKMRELKIFAKVALKKRPDLLKKMGF